ncbi:MAG: shikimate dehydrogenase [Dehalococcoidia bacterium]|nr:shikimate dehydrogenase [Dehalococcoidia bacterium]
MAKFIGLIGNPAKHSISPYFQQAALDYYHFDIRYETWETNPAKLEAAVAGLREPQNLGANVTVPYKEAVLPLLDEVDDMAGSIGAVNTIVKRDDTLLGFNTDAHGFIRGLRQERQFNPEGKRVVVLGAGGVARAVCFALLREKVSSLIIINRTPVRASTLASSLESYMTEAGLKTELTTLPWQSLTSAGAFARCHLMVNCTTMGMKHSSYEGKSPLSIEMIPKGALVYDLVYNPYPTPLLQLAQKAGANILGGLAMLVYQGAASFELWMGKKAPVDVMLDRAKKALIGGEK